jgi:hypothetical protein
MVSARDRTTYGYDALGNAITPTFLAPNQTVGPSTQAVYNALTTVHRDEKLNATTEVMLDGIEIVRH